MCDALPKYEQIKQYLKKRIQSGALAPGAPVPSERELTTTFAITRNQTRQSLRELELEGYIVRSQGKRSVVAAPEKRASPLVMANKPVFAIAMQDQQTLHTQKILQGFMHRASAVGMQTIAYNLEFDSKGALRFIEHIRNSGMAGLAFWPHFDQPEIREVLRECIKNRFPVVLIDRYLHGLDIDAVVTDNCTVGRLLTDALLHNGHRRIAFVAEEDVSSTVQERYEGCCQAQKAAGIDFDESLYAVLERGYGEPESAVCALQSRKNRPTAYYCVHDRLAQAVSRVLVQLGYAIPDDVQIACLGDELCAQRDGPPMVILKQPSTKIGMRAFDLLWKQFNGTAAIGKIHRLAPQPEEPVKVYPGEAEMADTYSE